MKHPRYIHKNPYSFVLADGVAPFQVLGLVELSLRFSNVTTKISANIARNLCTDMILGMDYINLYNLSIDVKQQTISIEHHNRILTINIDSDYELRRIPVVSSESTYLPPCSTRSTLVSIPISSICSSFIPNYHLFRDNSLSITNTPITFQNYCSTVTFANTSSYPRFVRKDFCIGYLICDSPLRPSSLLSFPLHKSFGAIGSSGEFPASFDFHPERFPNDPYRKRISHCNTIKPHNPIVNQHIDTLTSRIGNEQHRNSLRSLLSRFQCTFNISNHNIADTPIHHVINTIPHSPPACKPYPQPDKEEPMYKLIQEFLSAGLISESHSPYAAPAILVKKKDGSYRFVVDYRKLNLVTIKDSSPLPNMEDTIRKLGQGYTYFSKLDLKSGFYQIPINENDKEKTAFVTPFGLYQFNVLPMGLKNSPPTFQKVMTDTLFFRNHSMNIYITLNVSSLLFNRKT